MSHDLRLLALDLIAAYESNDLERVMLFFAEHCEYWPGDGHCFRGKRAGD